MLAKWPLFSAKTCHFDQKNGVLEPVSFVGLYFLWQICEKIPILQLDTCRLAKSGVFAVHFVPFDPILHKNTHNIEYTRASVSYIRRKLRYIIYNPDVENILKNAKNKKFIIFYFIFIRLCDRIIYVLTTSRYYLYYIV